MAVYKYIKNSKSGSKEAWRVAVYYRDWQGNRQKHEKKGFAYKRDALAYEESYKRKMAATVNMTFTEFCEVYYDDVAPRLKETTMGTKKAIVEKHILPYLGNKKIAELTQHDVLVWQNCLLQICDDEGKHYSQTYLRTIENQLRAILNHAVTYYNLQSNPCRKQQKIGKKKPDREMLFWTIDEYKKFSKALEAEPVAYYAFQLLYWTGIRLGELLAVTPEDIDLEKKILHVRENYQKVGKEGKLQTPKTESSIRDIDLPDFLVAEMEDYLKSIYGLKNDQRIFILSKHQMHSLMSQYSQIAGVKRIRIHDIRHSHVALLIEMGYAPIQITKRMGHSTAEITELYGHLYPGVQKGMASALNEKCNEMRKTNE